MKKAGDSRIQRETTRAFEYFGDKLEEKFEEDNKKMKKEIIVNLKMELKHLKMF